MAEQQQEIELTGCKHCGAELKDEFEQDKSICSRCSNLKDMTHDSFRVMQDVISEVIYGKLSKSDFKLINEIIYKVLEQDFFLEFEINQTHLAEKLGLKQSNISRSLKKIAANGRILVKRENSNKYYFKMAEDYLDKKEN